MRKQRKKYLRPKNLFAKERIDSDKNLAKTYGLKNRTEIWKAESNVDQIRRQAKKLILEPEKQQDFFKRLERMGLSKEGATIDAILALKKEDLLERRLQTIVFKKGIAKTIKEARQFITHRKIKIGDRIVTVPSYIVKVDEENKISLVVKQEKKEKKQEQGAKEEKIAEEKQEVSK